MIDLVIVVLYLVVTLAVGILAGRNVKSMKDFSVSSKIFPTSVLVSTIFATWMGGDDLIGVSERVYSVGLAFFVLVLGQTLSLFFHARVIAPKVLRDFPDKVSIGEIMGDLYGKPGQIMSGVANVLFSIGYIAVQVSAIGYICNLFFGVSHFFGTVIGSFIVIMYSSFGGIRSVVFTDVLQFGILIIGIPLMANVALEKVGGWEYLLFNLPEQHLELTSYQGSFLLFVVYFIYFVFPGFSPMIIQRILMAKDERQASQSLVISGILYVPFYAVISIIALSAVLMFPGIDPNNAFLNVLDYSLPTVVKGIAISGVLAVIMSTADSFLNVSAIAVTKDVFAVLWPSRMNDKSELMLSRGITVLLGIVSINAATKFSSMVDFGLYFSNFWTPTVVAPMLLYLLNFKTDIKTYLVSIVVGFVSIVFFRYSVSEDCAVVSQVVGAVVTFVTMYVLGKYLKTLSRPYNSSLAVSRA
ncbi:MAG: sodium:solute symporter family protein [Alphaproteobacteria bacterium]|nr:sodium:solute symporter family protein [Alphaproteobacteria bacterium]